jgi:hypothetical protein
MDLVKRNTNTVDTDRSNRKGLPLDFRNSKLKKNKRIARYNKKLMA